LYYLKVYCINSLRVAVFFAVLKENVFYFIFRVPKNNDRFILFWVLPNQIQTYFFSYRNRTEAFVRLTHVVSAHLNVFFNFIFSIEN